MSNTEKSCAEIFLSKAEKKAFQKFKNSNTADLTCEEHTMLLTYNLVTKTIDGKTGYWEMKPDRGRCMLSDFGKKYREYLKNRLHEKRVENIRYIITTAIALAAFVKSFFF